MRWLCVGALALAAGCAGTLHRAAEDAPPVARASLEAHLRVLAGDGFEGRMTGTPGYQAAAEYVAAQFRQLGLKPAGTEGFLQPVPYAVARIDAEGSRVRLHRGSRARTLAWKQDWIAGADVLRERTHVKAGMVFVGYGVRAPELGHDDYAGVDVRGKVVVYLLGAPKRFAANPRAYHSAPTVKEAAAAAQGAVGTIVLRDAHSAGKYKWEMVANNAGRVPSMKWVAPDGRAADYFPELRGSIVLSEAAAAAMFDGAPKSHREVLEANAAGEPVPTFVLPGRIEIEKRGTVSRLSSPNVAAVLPGSDPALAAEHVVYSAHLDHLGVGAPVSGDAIYNGAYDNAMGVAMMLETARALAALKPRRSILFVAVGGEERFLQGSDYFAQHPTVPVGQLVANINLDNPLVLFPLAEVVAYGGEHSTLGAAIEQAARAEGLRLAPDPQPDEVMFIRSDQFSFARQGVPGVMLKPGFVSADPAVDGGKLIEAHQRTHYHQPSDDLSRPVDWDSVVRFTRVNARAGALVANAAERPRWHPGNFFGELFGRDRTATPPASGAGAATWSLAVHGGASMVQPGRYSEAEMATIRAELSRALAAGGRILADGGSSLDAVQATVVVLEDSPWFNAGKGAVFTRAGHNELDASIMDGATGKAGAVAFVRRIRNPIALARLVMERTPHVMLAGDGAETFAVEQGVALVDPKYFHTERRWRELQEFIAREQRGRAAARDAYFGTVGAVARDRQGRLAAATSTGGLTGKRYGRIGDAPIIGAGTFADARCAVSATGHGEFFIRHAVAHDICARTRDAGLAVGKAAEVLVHEVLKPAGGEGGVVTMDAQGQPAHAFNTSWMARGIHGPAGVPTVALLAGERLAPVPGP